MNTSENMDAKKALVVDMTRGNPVLAQVPDTLLLVEAQDHAEARTYIENVLKPQDLEPGTTNVRRIDESRKWWLFGVFL